MRREVVPSTLRLIVDCSFDDLMVLKVKETYPSQVNVERFSSDSVYAMSEHKNLIVLEMLTGHFLLGFALCKRRLLPWSGRAPVRADINLTLLQLFRKGEAW